MTPPPKTVDHELKLGRARKHFEELKVEIGKWLAGDHYTVRSEREADGRTLFLATAEQPPPNPISLLIGDCLHNLRSSLDLLAYALAVSYTVPLPLEIAESSEFPIFGDEDRHGNPGMGAAAFKRVDGKGAPVPGSGLFKIRGIDPKAQAIIEGLQPYHRGNAFRAHPLWTLHELDNVNKHRLLHTGLAWSGGIGINTAKSVNFSIEPGILNSYGGVIETDTPIARIPLGPADRSRAMQVDVQPQVADIAFAKGSAGMQDISVIKTLSDIHNYVVSDVLLPLAPFLS